LARRAISDFERHFGRSDLCWHSTTGSKLACTHAGSAWEDGRQVRGFLYTHWDSVARWARLLVSTRGCLLCTPTPTAQQVAAVRSAEGKRACYRVQSHSSRHLPFDWKGQTSAGRTTVPTSHATGWKI
jgi:hypothetical protein